MSKKRVKTLKNVDKQGKIEKKPTQKIFKKVWIMRIKQGKNTRKKGKNSKKRATFPQTFVLFQKREKLSTVLYVYTAGHICIKKKI